MGWTFAQLKFGNQPREQKEAWTYTIGIDGELKGCTHTHTHTHSLFCYSLHGGRFAWGLFSSSDPIWKCIERKRERQTDRERVREETCFMRVGLLHCWSRQGRVWDASYIWRWIVVVNGCPLSVCETRTIVCVRDMRMGPYYLEEGIHSIH